MIPDSLRQQLAPVIKHHFWILAVLVPLVLVPALFVAKGQLKGKIDQERATIDGHVSALNAVRSEPDHPNDAWSKAFESQSQAIREEMMGEWQAFWESQQPLRKWPAALKPDFLERIKEVESNSGKQLGLQALQRYQNTVPDLVRGLPERMGCEEMMSGQDENFGGGGPGRGPGLPAGRGFEGDDDDPAASRSLDPLVWKAEDQKRLFMSFAWSKTPTTTQVLLAQEELWVYGLFCDAIKRMNEGAKGAFDAAITSVDELAVGYPAAEEKPGGQGAGRILGLRQAVAGSGMEGLDDGLPPMDPGMGRPQGGMLEGRPTHPRFSAGGGLEEGPGMPGGRFGPSGRGPASGEGMDGEGEEQGPVLTFDDMLKQWIYVDFEGHPLTATELATVPDAQMVHLMPFVLRVEMDQRQLDRLLVELAGSPIPIDVRQVRINPSSQGMGGEGFGGGGFPALAGNREEGGAMMGERRRRAFDMTVELRGTVGLATPPNPSVFGETGSDEAAADEGGGA